MAGRIHLGDEVKDTITGFQGIAIGVTEWLHGCRRVTVQPRKLNDGKVADTYTFDEPQLAFVRVAVVGTTDVTVGPIPTPTRAATPARR